MNRIIRAVAPQPDDIIIEIGPGTGAITRPLAARAGYVVAIEADSRLVERLKLDDIPNLSLVEGDALSVDWAELVEAAIQDSKPHTGTSFLRSRVRVVANLPYYISTPILQVLIEHRAKFYDITVMLQDEVVNRIASQPGSREYGYLSVLIQFYCDVRKLFEVAPSAFKPAPEVRSAVVRLSVRQQPAVAVGSEKYYFALVKAAFSQRRKTILNNLKAASRQLALKQPIDEALKDAGINPLRRAETLSLDDFGRLCDALNRSNQHRS